METNDPLSDDDVKKRLAEVMDLYVGNGKYISYEALSKATGIKKPTLYSYTQSRAQMPGLAAALRILRALPPKAELLLRGEMATEIPHDPVEFVRKANVHISELVHENNKALVDNDICRKERLKISGIARRTAPFVLGLLALAAAVQ